MEQPLLTIGAFARAVGLAPSALRYYDECGLLRPAEVDEATGYRYYTPDLARRAQAVAQMRDAGLSIENLREYDYCPFNIFADMVEDGPGVYRIRKFGDRVPYVYALTARPSSR